MRVLIAEDDATTRMVLKHALESLGHQVVETATGLEALRVIRDDHFPLLIADWLMPELDGLDLCREIRDLKPRRRYTYTIMLTQLEGKRRYLEAMDAGADDFLSKPFDRELLAARLRVAERILGLEKKTRELAKLIPICMYCKKARNDKDYWEQLDKYLMENTDTRLTHGICPECYRKHFEPAIADPDDD